MKNKSLSVLTTENQEILAKLVNDYAEGYQYLLNSFQKKKLDLTAKYKEKYDEMPYDFLEKNEFTEVSIDNPRRLQHLMAHTIVLCEIGIDLCVSTSTRSIKSVSRVMEMVNYFSGVIDAQNEVLILKKLQARINANKRHAENHAIKNDAMKYYSENIHKFKSKDDAAEQIAGKIVNAKFRTVRQWITNYHKKLRSASTT
jgi:hypothetical protein